MYFSFSIYHHRIFRITLSMLFQFVRYHKNGYGVKRGVQMLRKLRWLFEYVLSYVIQTNIDYYTVNRAAIFTLVML